MKFLINYNYSITSNNYHPELVSGSAKSADAALRLRLVKTGSQSSPSVLTFPLLNKFGKTEWNRKVFLHAEGVIRLCRCDYD